MEEIDAKQEAQSIAQRSRNEPARRRLWPRRQEEQSAQAETRAEEVTGPDRRGHLSAPQKRWLVGDLELQPGMDHVRVISHRIFVRGVELRPTFCVAHLGFRDVRERVA